MYYIILNVRRILRSAMLAQKVKRIQSPNSGLSVVQASIITGVPVKTINQYIDRDFASLQLASLQGGVRVVTADKVLAIRLAYEFADTLTVAARTQLINVALAMPRAKRINLEGGKIIVPVDLARAQVRAGLVRLQAAFNGTNADAAILGGEPCLKGTRISVYTIAELHNASGRDAVMDAYDITDQQLDAAIIVALAIPRRGRPRGMEAKLNAAKPKARRTKSIKVD
jgi:uncharacterized protein (DUF433 family)